METEDAGEEGVRGSNNDAAANKEGAGADEPAGEEAAKAAAAEAGEGSGDRTDGPEAAGAPGAAPTADPLPLLQRQAPKSPSPVPT